MELMELDSGKHIHSRVRASAWRAIYNKPQSSGRGPCCSQLVGIQGPDTISRGGGNAPTNLPLQYGRTEGVPRDLLLAPSSVSPSGPAHGRELLCCRTYIPIYSELQQHGM